jgi:hypothetical protein
MLGWLYRLRAWVASLWAGWSDKDKEKIVDSIVACFTAIFKAYYHASKSEKENE